MTSNSDHNLLFGIIALQMDFVQREQLVAATSAWLINKSQRIDEILVEQGALSEEDRQLLSPLVARHLENHGGDPQKSLAAMSSIGSVADELRSLGDVGIEATLSIVGSNPRDLHAETVTHDSGGSSTVSPVSRDTTDARFRVLRSHAKGGLGEVYVAKDTELNREVALKEIQTKYADDENSRLRFLLEAEVTGGLEHPGIVPVYGLGRYEDGRPFYAMRFIKGDSLQEATDRFHRRTQPGADDGEAKSSSGSYFIDFNGLEFRKLLGRFIDVCQAIQYAHSRGVLHRDLKPGNIMLGKYGETLVVDWGLAKAQERDEDENMEGEPQLRPASASGSAPTMMGSAIGTPAFMPPEQAAGDLDAFGPASDVYSLGATLYYLLTGQPPFRGESVGAVLDQVERGKFAPPRIVQSDVPKALEAICLRAMEMRPKHRYASPVHLADDVERFLADEPVFAFQEPSIVRARRWVRKHQTLATATAAVVLVSAIGLGVFTSIIAGKNAELTNKNSELTAAKNLAEVNERSARQQSQLALATLTATIGDIQHGLKNVAGGGEIRRRLLQTSMANLESVATQYVEQADIDFQTFNALIQMGDVVMQLGGQSDGADASAEASSPNEKSALNLAATFYRRAHEIAKLMAVDQPDDPKVQRSLLTSYSKIGELQRKGGDLFTALDAYQQSLEISEQLAKRDPSDTQVQRDLSISYTNIGDAQLLSGDLAAARTSYQQSLEISKQLVADHPEDARAQRDLAVSYNKEGDVLFRTVDLAAALAAYQQSLKISKQLAKSDPANTEVQNDLSISHDKIGQVHITLGDLPAALASHRRSLEISQQLAKNDPANAQAQHALSVAHNNIADVQSELNDWAAALTSYQKSLAIVEQLAEDDLDNVQAQRDLAALHNNMGVVHFELGDTNSALASHHKGLDIRQELAANDPANFEIQRDVFLSHFNISRVQFQLGDKAAALTSSQRSLEISKQLAADHPNDTRAQDDLSDSYFRIGEVQRRSGDFAAALTSYRRSLEIRKQLATRDPDNAQSQHDLLLAHANIGVTLRTLEQFDESVEAFDRALAVANSAHQRGLLGGVIEPLMKSLERGRERAHIMATGLGDWDQVLKLPTNLLPLALEFRAIKMTGQASPDEAAQAARMLRDLDVATQSQRYNAVRVFSHCAASIQAAEGKELSADQTKQREAWLNEAIDTLKKLIADGWSDFPLMRQDPDLEILRDLPEFKALIPKSD